MNGITVLGASGFIGSHLVRHARRLSLNCEAPDRNEDLKGKHLGTVFYCIGLTADWRSRVFDTVSAHVCRLREILSECDFDMLVYLSSARLYDERLTETTETTPIVVEPAVQNDLYNISKVMGESLILHCARPAKIVRLSNVYGDDVASDNFLTDIVRDALTKKHVVLRSSLDSSKDYVSVDAVVELLVQIASKGKQRLYNVASGVNTTHHDLLQRIQEVTGASYSVVDNPPRISFRSISIDRIRDEFGACPSDVIADLPAVIDAMRRHLA